MRDARARTRKSTRVDSTFATRNLTGPESVSVVSRKFQRRDVRVPARVVVRGERSETRFGGWCAPRHVVDLNLELLHSALQPLQRGLDERPHPLDVLVQGLEERLLAGQGSLSLQPAVPRPRLHERERELDEVFRGRRAHSRVHARARVGGRVLRRELLVERADLFQQNLELPVADVPVLPLRLHLLLEVQAELHRAGRSRTVVSPPPSSFVSQRVRSALCEAHERECVRLVAGGVFHSQGHISGHFVQNSGHSSVRSFAPRDDAHSDFQ